MKNLEEILMVNGIAVLMMVFLLSTRRRNRESLLTEDKIYDGMVMITAVGAILESVSFLIDAKQIPYGRMFNYAANSLLFLGTITIAVLWCSYVDLRIYRNSARTSRRARILIIPWALEVLLILFNLMGSGVLFTVTEDNIYQRGNYVAIVYLILVGYYAYSVFLVRQSHRSGLKVPFFPVNYFIGPCLAGTVIQLFRYGISAAWISVAIALIFVQVQSHSEDLLIDSLSGLFNRRYLNSLLHHLKFKMARSLYGIMMDVNDFKNINDSYGHGKGDEAIRVMGRVLSSSVPDSAMAIRYAGDEFMVLMPGADQVTVLRTMDKINENLQTFNETTSEPFRLSVSMGYARLEKEDASAEDFLRRMDESMYQAKREYHLKSGRERRRE